MQQRNGARELGLIVATLAAVGRFVTDEPLWVATALTVIVAAAGTASLLGELRPWRWPLDRVSLPAMAAFASVGVAHLIDRCRGWRASSRSRGGHGVGGLDRDGLGHARGRARRSRGTALTRDRPPRASAPSGWRFWVSRPSAASFRWHRRRRTAAERRGIPGHDRPGRGHRRAGRLPDRGRAAALAGHAAVAFYQYSMIVAPVGVLVRVLALPRLFGPAVLVLAVYILTSLRESDEPVRFNAACSRRPGC